MSHHSIIWGALAIVMLLASRPFGKGWRMYKDSMAIFLHLACLLIAFDFALHIVYVGTPLGVSHADMVRASRVASALVAILFLAASIQYGCSQEGKRSIIDKMRAPLEKIFEKRKYE